MAKDYAERASWVLKEAEGALVAANYAICLTFSSTEVGRFMLPP
jgi:hypothetical protein